MSRTHHILTPHINMGADPELFLTKNGEVIGAEKGVPEKGIAASGRKDPYAAPGNTEVISPTRLVRDGVQVELHPDPQTCRVLFCDYMGTAMQTIRSILARKKMDLSFAPSVIEVPQKVLDSLSEESRVLGCQPSLNIYDSAADISAIDGSTYRWRAAGGHIHIGLDACDSGWYETKQGKPLSAWNQKQHLTGSFATMLERLVVILDILVGNTCVLLDTDPLQVERRKVYGRAGEYRTPSYGLEYRTPSNFWMRSPLLAAFVLGMVKLSVGVLDRSRYTPEGRERFNLSDDDAEQELLAPLEPMNIRNAINLNDQVLAQANFDAIKPWLEKWLPHWRWTKTSTKYNGGLLYTYEKALPAHDHIHPLTAEVLPAFEWVVRHGIDELFPADKAFDAWCALAGSTIARAGWEVFLANIMKKNGGKG